MADTISLSDLINRPLPRVSTQIDLANAPTARETQAQGLIDVSNRMAQSGGLTPLTAVLGGIAGGVGQGMKENEAGKRNEKLEAIRAEVARQEAVAAETDAIRTKLVNAQLADQLMMQNGKVVGDVLQTLELGNSQPAVDFIKANQEVATLLGDDGPGGMEINNIILDVNPKDGTKQVRAVWVNPDGTEVRGRPIAFDGLLQRYAPDAYSARSEAALEAQRAETDQRLQEARIATERAQAGSYNALSEQRRRVEQSPTPAQTTEPQPRAALPEMTAGQKRAFDVQTKVDDKAKGKTDVASILDDISTKYGELNRKGGIVSTDNNAIQNIVAKAGSSDIGQIVGGTVGTEEQSVRQSIRNSLPLLMSAIKNATGMSSQQMNSNAELQFYMQAATDPSRDIQSNLNAIQNLRKMFVGESAPAAPTPSMKEKYGLK
jgi:hypothetical protein